MFKPSIGTFQYRRFAKFLEIHGRFSTCICHPAQSKSGVSSSRDKKSLKTAYRKTLNLPKTSFPLSMKDGAAARRELEIQKKCCFDHLYNWQRNQEREKEFTLHDGPPYANGDPHVGHALNKILKDITCRYKVLTGHKVNYVPGWDCHGMPIEQKALAIIRTAHTEMDPLEIRQMAKTFASKALNTQRKAFQRWGVMADWQKGCYFTYDKAYVSAQLDVFYKMYQSGVIYQDYMPVFWSPSSRTALAEAELEYNDQHKSTSVHVRFPISRLPESLKNISGMDAPCWAVIWTTTPWTLPCNRAISYGPGIKYSFVKLKNTGDIYLICSEFLEKFRMIIGDFEVLTTVSGNDLAGMTYKHPLYEGMESPFLAGSHVTVEKGTGLVHTAPAHGPEDFQVAIKHGISIDCHVDEDGRYNEGVGPALQGKSVLEEGSEAVLSLMSESILHREDFIHSYPYDWRSKRPVILRASNQWFVNTSKIKARAMECVKEEVSIYPRSVEQGMMSQVERRTYWCISRQRVWGVPLPVFYRLSDGAPLISRASIDHLKNLVEKHGTDYWWTLAMDELLPPQVIQESGFNPDDKFVPGKDILDIWFDSGSSWAAVLQGKQADVYMEGLDQFGGWFQSSLLTSVAAQNKPPYKALVVHGFVMDEEGKKMSKSVGNVVDPHDIINGGKEQPAYGADVLRWWAAQSGLEVNVNIGPSVIQSCHEQVFRVRKALRFLMGNLHDFNPNTQKVPYESLLPVDQYMLHVTSHFIEQVTQAYDDYKYSRVVQLIEKFISTNVSSFHCHVIKDRLYCSMSESAARRSGQTVQYLVLQALLQTLAPILPHLAEEAHQACQPEAIPVTDSIFKEVWKGTDREWNNTQLANVFTAAFDIRNSFYNAIGSENPVHYDVHVYTQPQLVNHLKVLQEEGTSSTSQLVEILQCSHVLLSSQSPQNSSGPTDGQIMNGQCFLHTKDGNQQQYDYQMKIKPAEKSLCDRCRKYTSSSRDKICERCSDNLSEGWDQ